MKHIYGKDIYRNSLLIDDFLEAYREEFYEFAEQWFQQQEEAEDDERETVEDR